MIMIFLMILVNIGISFWNAKEAGKIWAESKGVGGWVRVLTWCAVIQSAIGFTYAYAIIIGALAYNFGYISPYTFRLLMDLTYVLIIIPALGSGLAITIHSWIAFAREKSLMNLGTAGWNTFAQAYNMYNAYQSFGEAFLNVADGLGSIGDGDSDNNSYRAILLVLIAALAGIFTTMTIVQRYAASLPVSEAVRSQNRDLSYR